VCPFPTAQAAVDTTVELLQGGIPMAKIGEDTVHVPIKIP